MGTARLHSKKAKSRRAGTGRNEPPKFPGLRRGFVGRDRRRAAESFRSSAPAGNLVISGVVRRRYRVFAGGEPEAQCFVDHPVGAAPESFGGPAQAPV
jgi:hypothetical protein